TAAAGTDVSVTASTHAAAAVAVNGGDDVSVTTTGATTGTVTVGATTAAAGSVTVNVTQAAMADGAGATTQVGGLITVTGGDSITVVNTVAGSTGGSNHAGDIVTASAVTATGDASTTSVSVTQTAEAARVADATGVTGSAAIANGVVTIADAVGVATALDTISTVTLNNYANSTVASSALTTVNVTGGSTAALASGTLGLNTQSTAAGGATTLNINGSGFIGAIDGTQADDYTTVNIAASSDFTIADVNFALATAVNASGAGVTTITALTDVGAVTAFTSTGGGLELGAAIGTAVTFTGGAGADSVILGATTKDIDMGAGDDTVTINAVPGAGGSIAGGAGDDTIVANTNTSSISASAAIGGFETLRVAGTAAQGAHNATGFAAIELGVTAAAASSFTNVAAGVDMTILGSLAGAHSVVLADATGTADSMDITLSSAGALDAQTADLTVAGVETFTITTVDTNTTAHTNLLDLVAAAATSVTVTGNAGLDMGTSVAALVTNFDASGVSGAAADAAAMAVTYTSDNVTVGENVTIKGGSGNDALTGGAVTHDTIEGGAGVDTIVYTGGNDVFTGGAGN
ncbi:S-layer protein, partial [Lentibacter algarum]